MPQVHFQPRAQRQIQWRQQQWHGQKWHRQQWRQRSALFSLAAMAAFPLLLCYIVVRALGRRPLVGVAAKLSGTPSPDIAPGAVLIHGVSLGETALMRPVVPHLLDLGATCLLTTTTETGWQGLEKNFPDLPRAFLPFDLPWAVERFLARTKPAAVVLLEAEFWPLWLCACFRRGIPVIVVNARVSPRSFKRFGHARALIAPLMRGYAAATAQNGLYAARLRRLGCHVAVPCGSLKADLVRLANAAQIDAEAERIGLGCGRPVLLLASTSAGEEATVLRAWLAAKPTDWHIIICPRHPERGAELAGLVRSLGMTPFCSSKGQRLPLDSLPTDSMPTDSVASVLIVDEIGHLGALYGCCARAQGIAVVGGSLGSGRGGQNMFEAAAAACATVVGWDTRSQPDSMALLRTCGGVIEVPPDSLGEQLLALRNDPQQRAELGRAGHTAWRAGQGATARHLAVIAPVLRASLERRKATLRHS